MFSKSAEYYDLIYSKFKDYESEAGSIRVLLSELHPAATTILDVACGTGEHVRILREKYDYLADGIDLNEKLVAIAREKDPEADFYCLDMTTFKLDKKYDVILCLFSSIAYAKTLEAVILALECFREHLNDDGIILVEPWFSPGELKTGRVTVQTVEEDISVTRMSHLTVDEKLSTIRFDYLIGTSKGISHEKEHHALGLFSVDDMNRAFTGARLSAEFREKIFSPKGLYIASSE